MKAIRAAFPIVFLATIPALALAQEYVPLTAIPGTTDTTSFTGFLNAAFRLGIAAASLLAVVVIAYSGLVYMTSDIVESKSAAVGRITDALWGLALILFSVIILRVINPDILKFNFKMTPIPARQQQQVSPFTPDQEKTIKKLEEECNPARNEVLTIGRNKDGSLWSKCDRTQESTGISP